MGDNGPVTDEDDADDEDDELSAWLTLPMARALRQAVRVVAGGLQEDMRPLARPDALLEEAPPYLPPGYPYDRDVLTRFLYCLVTVSAKLDAWMRKTTAGEGGEVCCACLAEELMLYAVAREAELLLADDWELLGCAPEDAAEADWGAFHDLAFEDADFEMLFQSGGSDAVADAAVAVLPGHTSMALRDWFAPFNPTRGVSPLCWDGDLPDALFEQDPSKN